MTRWGLPALRRGIQIASIVVLVLLPLLSLYTHFHSARAIGDLPPDTWRGAAVRQIDNLVGDIPSRRKAVETTQGTFWSARILGISLTDPLAGAEAIVSSRSFYVPLLWSLIVPVVLSVVLGRVFCGWICPMNTLLELVDKCRRVLGILEIRERDVRFSKATKYVVLAVALGFVAIGGVPFLAMIYPPAVISREIHLVVFGAGIGLGAYLILAICAFELFVSRRWWCRTICPGGATYSLLGRFRPIRVRRNADKCIECGDCVRVCQFDLRPMLVETTGMECTNCGSCVSGCGSRALGYSLTLPGLGPRERSTPPPEDRNTTRRPSKRAMGAVILVLVAASPAAAHHILGLPHYSYKDNYPQAPTLEYPATTGPYDVLMTSYPGRPVPGEASTVCFYIKDRNTDLPYDRPVTVQVLKTSTFGSNTVIHDPATRQPFDNQHKYTITFPDEAEYIVELTMDVEGKTEVIPFLVVVGSPTAAASVVIAIVAGLSVFLIVVRAVKKKRDRRRRSRAAMPGEQPEVQVASRIVSP